MKALDEPEGGPELTRDPLGLVPCHGKSAASLRPVGGERRDDRLSARAERLRQDVPVGLAIGGTDERRVFSEVQRILRPAGRFLYADIVVASELPESIRRDIDLWSG